MVDKTLQKKYESQAQMLANKVKKKFKHLRKRYAKQNLDIFRLYDWDIPEDYRNKRKHIHRCWEISI